MEIKNYLTKNINNELKSFFIDAHCHFQYFSKEQISTMIKKCSDFDIKYFLTNATKNEDFDQTIKLSEEFPEIIPGVGYHPWYLENVIQNDKWFEEYVSYIEKLEQSKVTYFIGEIGIDGGRPKKKVPLDKQSEIFKKQFELANEMNKLVTIHCVYEWEKLFKIFEKSKIENLVNNKIILHSFQGNKKIMEKFCKFNVWFSLSAGCFNEKNLEMIKEIPIERLLLESDSPSMFNKEIYTSEEEYNFYFPEEDKENCYKNHPLSLLSLAKKISELKNCDFKEFCEKIKLNNEIVIKNLLI